MYFSSHNHTFFSNYRLPDATNKPNDLFERALDLRLTGFAVTDHEALSAHVQIMQYRDKLIKEGRITDDFTVAFGDEAYLVDELEMNQKYYHWLLIAKDAHGHKVLRKLSSQAWENSYWDRGMERVPLTKTQVEQIMLENNGKGHLIATSACLGGELGSNALEIKMEELDIPFGTPNQEFIKQCKQKMVEYVEWNQKVFGDDFYIELAPNDKEDQRFSNRMLSRLAKAMDVRLIVATDSHYLSRDEQSIHRAFLNSKEGEREVDEFYSTAYMMDYEDLKQFMLLDFSEEEFEEMISNLEEMRKGIESYTLFKEQEIPIVSVDVPSVNFKDKIDKEEFPFIYSLLESKNEQDLYWILTCLDQLEKRDKFNGLYLSTLNLEAEVIVKVSKRLGQSMASYYNTAQKLVEIMWDEGDSLVGTSRGSAMAFVSNWLLDITQIDPIPFKIPYWRHLSADRPELPDVDLDSQGFKREQVIEAVKNYFGEDRVLNICTYGTEGSKSAIATAARGLGIDNDISNYLSGLIPNERGFDWPIKDVVYGNPSKGRKVVGEFATEIKKYEGLLETTLSLEGLVSSRGSHASGVYIFNHDYTDINASMRTPNGQKVTQWDMHESDEMGGLKFDFLSIEGLDKIRATMDLLIEDNLMKWQGSLKATYDKYLHPDALDYDEKLWEPAWDGMVLDLFQFQTPVGGEAIKKARPTSVIEAAAINSLMRLMPMEDGTVPIDKFVRFKNNIQLWYDEINEAGVPEDEIPILEKHYLQSFGVPNTQEEMMILLMDPKICNFSQTDANIARKVVGKKQMDKIPWLKEKIFAEAVCSPNTIQYIWNTAIGVQMGYSFSLPHTVAYTEIALQELNLFNHFPSIYWNTGCLIINAGDVGNSTDYAKIAVALGDTLKHGINIELVDINESNSNFKPNIEGNYISYGLRSLTGISSDFINTILELRPFKNLKDFCERANPNKAQATSLIKSGAFSKIESDRKLTLLKYAKLTTARRKNLTIAQIPLIQNLGLLEAEYIDSYRVYEFNRYIKNELTTSGEVIWLNERAENFLVSLNLDSYIETFGEKVVIAHRDWKKIYDMYMDKIRPWLKENKERLLKAIFDAEMVETYASYGGFESLARWEMEAMSFYYSEHELKNINTKKYGIVEFSSLNRSPIKLNPNAPFSRMRTFSIIGTILGKNKTKGSIDLLTPEGDVILVKMYKGDFSYYDKQISEKQTDGSKKVIEKSFFQRGNKLFIHGYRRDDQFIPKQYSNSPYPSVALILDQTETGDLLLKSSRG